jgi:hypothetical protein
MSGVSASIPGLILSLRTIIRGAGIAGMLVEHGLGVNGLGRHRVPEKRLSGRRYDAPSLQPS